MALLNIVRGEESKILSQPVSDGALLFATDTKKIYLDKGLERIEIASIQDLSNYITNSQLQEGLNTKAPLSHSHTVSQVTDLDTTISAAIGEEASARQKQDQLLEQAIDDKLGADDIIPGSNVQVTHDDESGHITISATDTKYTAGTGLGMISNGFYILNGGVGLNQLADDSVSESKLADGAVDTVKIADGAVTADKLAEGVIPEIPEMTLASLGITATAQELNYTDGVTSNIQTQLNGKAAASHTHDDRYYTENEVDDLLAAKANTSHTHSAANITSGTLALDRIPTITDAKIQGMSASKLTGIIPQTNLPSYVDDVLEYNRQSNFPEEGESGKIYVDTSTNKTYRWSGSSYVEISASLALGTNSSSAFRGDYGNIAYQHAIAKGSAFASGLYKITTNAQGHVTAATAVTKGDITALGIPGSDTNTNTTYTLTKSGSTITLTGSDGSKTSVTDADTNTTYSNMSGATSSAAGKAGLVPAPAAGASNRYLRSDGTWTVPPDTNTTYTLSSFGITATAAELNKLDGCTATVTELNYVDGVTSNIQTQLNGKAASSHTHSYLPLSGGTLTGTLTSRAITPSADSTYDIGTSSVRYRNIYADTITASTFSGTISNAATATQANYWTTARTLTFTGDVTGSVSIKGNANMSCAMSLAANSVTANEIAANAVGTSEIAANAVTLAKLGTDVGTIAVQTAEPTDSNVKLWIKI